MSLFFPGWKENKDKPCSISDREVWTQPFTHTPYSALTLSVGRSELTGRTAQNWDLSLIVVGRSRKQKSNVLIPACTPGRAYRSWEGPSSSCRSGCSWSRTHLCHLCLMSPVFLALKGSAPVICACPRQDRVILALQHTRTALWAACCLSLEMDATAERCRTQRLRVKSGASKALPCCSSLVSQSAHQTALKLQLCLEGTCGRTPAGG